jgi:hypothetical protein
MTAASLNALPSAAVGLTVIIMKIPYVGNFFGIVPPLVQLVATAASLFTLYVWLKHFGVVNWAQKVVMVLGILAVLGTGWGVISAVINSIRAFGSGGSGMVASANAAAISGDAEKAAAEAMKNAEEMMKKGGMTAEQTAEMQKKIAEAQKAAMAQAAKATGDAADAQEAAKKLTDAAMKQAADAQDAAKKAVADAEKTGKEAAKAAEKSEKAEKAAEKVEKKNAKKVEEDEPEEADTAPKPVKAAEKKTAPKPVLAAATEPVDDGTLTPFMSFIKKREAVEKTIYENPALLRNEDTLNTYKRYLKKTNDIRQKWAKKKTKDFAESKINDHMKDLEVFEGTSKLVDELYGKVMK